MTAVERQRRHRISKDKKRLSQYGAADYRRHLLDLANKAETAGYKSNFPEVEEVFDYDALALEAKNVLAIWQKVSVQYEWLADRERKQAKKAKAKAK